MQIKKLWKKITGETEGWLHPEPESPARPVGEVPREYRPQLQWEDAPFPKKIIVQHELAIQLALLGFPVKQFILFENIVRENNKPVDTVRELDEIRHGVNYRILGYLDKQGLETDEKHELMLWMAPTLQSIFAMIDACGELSKTYNNPFTAPLEARREAMRTRVPPERFMKLDSMIYPALCSFPYQAEWREWERNNNVYIPRIV